MRDIVSLIESMSLTVFPKWEPKLRDLAQQFHRKKKRDILKLIEQKKAAADRVTLPPRPASSDPRSAQSDEFQNALDDLRDNSIFEWSTSYADCLSKHFSRVLKELESSTQDVGVPWVTEPLCAHSRTVFSEAYRLAGQTGHGHGAATNKAIRGLKSFLKVPIGYYSKLLPSTAAYGAVTALRRLVSASIVGILYGFCGAVFGEEDGSAVLLKHPDRWLYAMGFLTAQDAEKLLDSLSPSQLERELTTCLLPLLDALGMFLKRRHGEYFPLPKISQVRTSPRSFQLSLRPPPHAAEARLIEVIAIHEKERVSFLSLKRAATQNVALVIAPLTAELEEQLGAASEVNSIVVAVTPERDHVASEAHSKIRDAASAQTASSPHTRRLTYNAARDFPLEDPRRARAYHVDRTSVRMLSQGLRERNGVRLWCSVRRSGKTTATVDLESTTDDSIIVSQTCGATDDKNATRFYDQVSHAVEAGRRVERDFVAKVVAESAQIDLPDKKIVLIVDEYESLFGQLKATATADPVLRYSVVQPILNQLTNFAQENLLVFLGQQPNAHYILMEQNQLAPYVEQEPFPLFEHRPRTQQGEFADLVGKVLSESVECAASFLDSLHEETAGHPYLTVEVLRELVEWLIERKRSLNDLLLSQDDFAQFGAERLRAGQIRLSREYEFFRRAASEAMSHVGHEQNPWLFTTYWLVRLLASADESRMRAERAAFTDLLDRVPIPDGAVKLGSEEVLRTATLANFLTYDDQWVNVKVRTLGRIAAAIPSPM